MGQFPGSRFDGDLLLSHHEQHDATDKTTDDATSDRAPDEIQLPASFRSEQVSGFGVSDAKAVSGSFAQSETGQPQRIGRP